MKIIIDECVPSIAKRGLPNREIVTVQEMGWAGIKNGELLKLVAAESMSSSLPTRTSSINKTSRVSRSFILLPSNQVPAVNAILPQLDQILDTIQPKQFIEL